MALALTSRRSTVAAVASALAAMALAAGIAGRSCRVSQPGPEATVRDLLTAEKAGDRDTVYELLSPATKDHLAAMAKRATDDVGEDRRYNPKDLISIASPDSFVPPTDITVLEETGEHAVVEIVSPEGRARMELVKANGRWRIDLPQYGRPQ